ncbi:MULTISPECIES: hypothetical protein [Methanobacterium]|uniref:Uncharacterized protein n=1 Tax=Methanobacterium veterum TaxID=408577 RepID=A0A9E5A645_9EURY|nr:MULTISPECIES: hypothetical protein [Methanobacterium]MCZ3367077.1 hypothetical protein [Methanobacterium veterum]MCZ3373776.1 hypothetical protein [Methanobacterium veterum]
MEKNIKKLQDEYFDLLLELPLPELKKIYHNMSYDAHKALYIDHNDEEFNKHFNDIIGLLERVESHRASLLVEDAKTLEEIIYELKAMIRSEWIKKDILIMSYTTQVGLIIDSLEEFEFTDDKEYLDKAKNSLNTLFEIPKDINGFMERLKWVVRNSGQFNELTDEDKEFIKDYKKFINIYESKGKIRELKLN